MKKIISLCLLALFSTSLAFASKQEFNIRLQTEPPTLDWNLATDFVSIALINNLMDGLARFDQKMAVKPSLASSWKISADRKTYTYTLRDDVKWTDGTPLTAQQFVDSWERLLNPKSASEFAYFLYDIVGAKEYNIGKLKDPNKLGFKAADDHTFVVTLNKPTTYFPQIPTFSVTYPIRKDLIAKYGDAWTDPKNIQTLGAFTLKEWKHDAKIVLNANDNYFLGRPKLNVVNAYIVSEDTTAINMFESGILHYVDRLPPLELDRLKQSPAFHSSPYLRGYYYGFNVQKKPFNDPRVRKAFAMAVDRKQVTEILKGGQIPTTSWVPKGMPGYEPDVGLPYNLDKAQKLLAEAGYPDGKGFPETTFYFDTRDDNKMIAERMQSMWEKNLGVKLHAQNEDWKVYLNHLSSDAPPIFRMGWGADYPDPDDFLELFTSNSGNNETRWKNSHYDELVRKAASEENTKKRLAYYREAQKILTEQDVAIVPLFIDTINTLISPKVKGIVLNPLNEVFWKDITME